MPVKLQKAPAGALKAPPVSAFKEIEGMGGGAFWPPKGKACKIGLVFLGKMTGMRKNVTGDERYKPSDVLDFATETGPASVRVSAGLLEYVKADVFKIGAWYRLTFTGTAPCKAGTVKKYTVAVAG